MARSAADQSGSFRCGRKSVGLRRKRSIAVGEPGNRRGILFGLSSPINGDRNLTSEQAGGREAKREIRFSHPCSLGGCCGGQFERPTKFGFRGYSALQSMAVQIVSSPE